MTRSRTHTRLAGLLLALTTTVALTACSSGTDSGDSESSGDAGGAGASREFGAQEGPMEDRATASDSAGAKGRAAVRLERSIIATGTVSLRADDVAEARRAVQRVVDTERGEVSDENTDTDEDGRVVYARLVLRIPSDRFDAAMTALEDIADLRHSERSAEDVTTQVIDTDVRVRAQQASLRRVEALLARADTLQQIIWIESQLTDRRAELDSLRQQQAWLADQTSFSTVTVDIEATPEKEEAEEDDGAPGFLAGLEGGWHALAATTATLLTVVGAVLPFAVVLVVVGLPVWLLVRRGARRRRTA